LFEEMKLGRFRWDSTTISLVGLTVNTAASIIMTLHVLLLHEKLQANKDGEAIIVFNDRESVEKSMMYVAVGLYFLSFFLFLWSAFLEQANRRKEMYVLSKYFGVDFSDISGVSFDDVEDFEEEVSKGYTLKKAKDVRHPPTIETHAKHNKIDL
jgi:hypothetical protein